MILKKGSQVKTYLLAHISIASRYLLSIRSIRALGMANYIHMLEFDSLLRAGVVHRYSHW